MLKRCPYLIASLLLCFALAACNKDDDYVYPDVLLEFANVMTDEEGYCSQLTTDNGEHYPIQPKFKQKGFEPQNDYRVVCHYLINAQQEAELYSCSKAISPMPKTADQPYATDPVSIQSVWMGNGYLNMVLRIMMHDKAHKYGIIEMPVTTGSQGQDVLPLVLRHERGDDTEGFFRKAYLSVPVSQYKQQAPSVSAISISINTYEQGMVTKTFAY